MPKVSGFVVPIMNPMNLVGNNKLFESLVLLANKHDYNSENHEDANREEEPEEPLCIVTEIAAIIFLVAFSDFFRSSANMELTSRIYDFDPLCPLSKRKMTASSCGRGERPF